MDQFGLIRDLKKKNIQIKISSFLSMTFALSLCLFFFFRFTLTEHTLSVLANVNYLKNPNISYRTWRVKGMCSGNPLFIRLFILRSNSTRHILNWEFSWELTRKVSLMGIDQHSSPPKKHNIHINGQIISFLIFQPSNEQRILQCGKGKTEVSEFISTP